MPEKEVRLIDANALRERMCRQCNIEMSDQPCEPDECFVRTVIMDTPTIDPESLRAQWISVEDRLPERTMPPKDVLVYHDLGCGMFIDRAWYSHEKNKWRSALGMNLKVTHWMPLPEPPKEV